jgi:thiamine-phosphate pyrophosphorylase
MQLIVISSPQEVAGETAIINGLFQAGLSRFHLRKPGSDPQQLCALLDDIDPVFYNRIALHQHHGLALNYGITRLHYTEQVRKQMMRDEWESQHAKGYTLSTSIHDFAGIYSLTAFDYLFFGPVFNSLSKPGHNSSLPMGFSLKQQQNIKPQVMAIGGIESRNIPTSKAMGFDGIAVLGTIWGHPENAIRTFENLQDTINTL